MRRFVFPWSIPLIALILAACPGGDNNDDDDDDDDDPPAEATPEELSAAIGDFFERCFGEAGNTFQAEAEPTLIAIIASQFRVSLESSTLAGFVAEGVEFDGVEAQGCIDFLGTAACSSLSEQPEACANVTTGTLLVDAPCTVDGACAEGLSCFQPDGRDFCGVCKTIGALNDPCEENDCGDGLECVANVCVTAEDPPEEFQEGDACDVNFDGCNIFNTGLACVNSICTPAEVVQVGAACDTSVEGAARYCVDRTVVNFCVPGVNDPNVGVCERRPEIGEPCLFLSLCIGNEAVCVDGDCAAGGASGEACAPNNTCQIAHTCTNGTCEAQFGEEFVAPVCE